jgi:hypothetical protein
VVGKETVTLNIVISKQLVENNVRLRFIVTWRTEPSWWSPPLNMYIPNDLDSELWVVGDPGHALSFHVDPSQDNRGDCSGPFPDACIEVDTTTGAGPETVDVRNTLGYTTYYFGIDNVNSSYLGVPPITQSIAKVQVYTTDGLAQTFEVPTVGSGELWYVFKFDTSETFTATNCLTTMPGDWLEPPTCP